MSVRAKFKVDSYSTQMSQSKIDESKGWDKDNMQPTELRTIVLSPVYGNVDASEENKKFWQYTPSGRIELGTVNPTAWKQFELGKEYYIDFTPAE